MRFLWTDSETPYRRAPARLIPAGALSLRTSDRRHWCGNPHLPAAMSLRTWYRTKVARGERRIATTVCALTRNDKRGSLAAFLYSTHKSVRSDTSSSRRRRFAASSAAAFRRFFPPLRNFYTFHDRAPSGSFPGGVHPWKG